MIPSLLLLSASVVASPVIVSEVRATREAGHLRVEVRADGGIDPEAARTRIDQGSLYLFLGGARVKADNRAWKLDEGVGEIHAHRHHTEIELDVPLTGNGCAGPVELEGTATGLTALVGCEGRAPAAVAQGGARLAAAKEKPAPKPAAAPVEMKQDLPAPAKQAAPVPAKAAETQKPAAAQTEAAALKNLVALPPADDEEEPAAQKAPAAPQKDDATAKTAEAPVAARVEFKADVPEKKVAPLPVETAAPAVGSVAAAAEAPAKAASVAPSGLRAVGLPALFLAGLAVAAYFFARKKRTLGTRRIQILETASLGPKRSLVIARIGEETLVLGASEAGITLLQTSDGNSPVVKTAASPLEMSKPADLIAASTTRDADEGPSEMDQSLIDALADVPEPDHLAPTSPRGSLRTIEGGLASLFGRKAAASVTARVPPKAAESFDDLLEDSVEDQELRRKLAAGMSARVR